MAVFGLSAPWGRAAVPQIVGTRADGSSFDPVAEPWAQIAPPALDLLERHKRPQRVQVRALRRGSGVPDAVAQELRRAAPQGVGRLAPLSRCRDILWALLWLVIAYMGLGHRRQPVSQPPSSAPMPTT
jgi:hypothetical protein